MRFLVRKRRQVPAVIIVALIDVLIVMLIFLLATTSFRQQPALRLQLPESTQAKKTGSSENPPVIVSIDPQGNLRLGAEASPVTADQLKAALVDRATKNPELILAINADKAAPWGQIVKVQEAAKAAKIKTVTAFMKEPAK